MATDISICSKALLKLGEAPISSFDEGTDASEACKAIYPDFAKYCMTLHPWTFCKKKIQLSRLVDTPTNEYQYAFQLPSDRLMMLAVYESDGDSAQPILHWDIFYEQIYADVESMWVDYIFNAPEEDWPPYFVEFVATALASELALTLTDQMDYKDINYKMAYGTASDNMSGGLLGKAKRIDSLQKPSNRTFYSSLIAARFAGARGRAR